MNIKGFISNILTDTKVRNVETVGRSIASDQTNDRDANGQEGYSQQQNPQHPPMSDEQLENSMEHLRNLAIFKENKWTVNLEKSEHGIFVIVQDNLGTLIRKIPEAELWTLPSDDSPRGQLLKRSA